MKHTKNLLLALAAGAFMASQAFSQPASNTNIVTGGLIEDGIVDQIDTGVEGKDFLFFGGYGLDSKQIQSGAGKRFGENLWFSIYDGWYMNAGTTNEENAKSDGVSSDGVNTDYTNRSSSASTDGSARVKNDFAFSAYFSDKIGGTFYWNTDRTNYEGYATTDPTGAIIDTSGKTTTKDSSEDNAAKTTAEKEYSTLENKESTNTFGISFNGVQTPYFLGDYNLYAALNSIELKKERRFIDLAWSEKTTLNGSTTDNQNQPSYSGTYSEKIYTPALSVEAGITLPKLWDFVSTKFTLIEDYKISFRSKENSYDYSEYTANSSASSARKTTSYSVDYGDYSNWNNKLTPRFDFDFDVYEKVILKARAQIPVSFGDKFTGADSYTTITKVKTTDKITGDVTSTRTVKTSGSASDTDIFTTNVTPEFSLGLVYQVVPEKFNINLGISASSGSLTWEKTTKTNSHIPEVTTTTYTNEAGETTTTGKTYTAKNGDGTSANDATDESEMHTFTAGTPTAEARFGFTWFLGEKTQVDSFMLFGSSAGTTTPTWAMNVTFGLKF